MCANLGILNLVFIMQAEPLMWHKRKRKNIKMLRSLRLRLCHINGSACLGLRRNENQALDCLLILRDLYRVNMLLSNVM